MKQIRLWMTLTFLVGFTFGVRAQVLQNHATPEVIFINAHGQLDTMSAAQVVRSYYQTVEQGFRQVGLPRFIIAGRQQKMIFGIGGNVNMRFGYDFDGMVDAKDFVTSAIPVPGSAQKRQKLQMDPSTSSLFFKAIANAGSLGPIVGYIKADFRNAGFGMSLNMAYVNIAGFSIGRRFTTFCDLGASPATVDYEGPNGYPLVYRTMIRYTHAFNDHWSVAVAAEQPILSATLTENMSALPQRMPDFPMYVQYSWNEGKSHLRASGILRNMYYYDDIADEATSVFGWGAQLSGAIRVTRPLTAYMQFLYGQGIAGYIQDITGSGLDLVANPQKPHSLQALPTMSWIVGAQYTFSPRWVATVAYSGVKVFSRNDYLVSDTYQMANYLSTNLFFNLTDYCQMGLSYMYGTRRNMNQEEGHANRIQGIVQYNF